MIIKKGVVMIKKILNSRVFAFILGGIFFSGLTVYAYTISSSDVSYEPEDNTWDATNVKVALDDLYEIANKNASDYSAQWFPEGIPLLPPLDASNYQDYITVESYSSANLHNGNEIWAPFSNRNIYTYYGVAESGTDYIVKINNPVYADKLICQAGGWTGGYSNYKVYYLDSDDHWNQIYSSGNISTYPAVPITIGDTVYGIKVSGYHVYTGNTPTHPMVIQRLQLVRNWS